MIKVLVVAVALLAAGCGTGQPSAETPQPRPTPTPSVVHTTAPATPPTSSAPVTPTQQPSTPGIPTGTPEPPLGTVPPPWLGTRVLPRQPGGYGEIRPTPKALRDRRFTLPDTVPMLPGTGFRAVIEPAPQAVLDRSTWRPGCPVKADQLSWVRLTFRGFDHRRHTGELLVNRSAATKLVSVFRTLYADDFPIEEMRITRRDEQTAPPTGDGNDTDAFNCRPAVGSTSYSEHAYGLAIDINPFQNPYVKGDLVLPELSSAYRDRGNQRPGMIEAGGPVVRAFARIGWGWGGSWHNLKDIQHFSANGR